MLVFLSYNTIGYLPFSATCVFSFLQILVYFLSHFRMTSLYSLQKKAPSIMTQDILLSALLFIVSTHIASDVNYVFMGFFLRMKPQSLIPALLSLKITTYHTNDFSPPKLQCKVLMWNVYSVNEFL